MTERNKAVVHAYVEKFNAGDVEGVRALCTAAFVIQGVLGQGGFDTAMPIWRDLHEAYGLQLTLVDLVAEVISSRRAMKNPAPSFNHPRHGAHWQELSSSSHGMVPAPRRQDRGTLGRP